MNKEKAPKRKSRRLLVVRQICAEAVKEDALECPPLGVRLPENAPRKSCPRYKNSATNKKSSSCAIFSKKAAPNLRQKVSPFSFENQKFPKEKKMSHSLHGIAGYVPARLSAGKRWYVEFYCLDPDTDKLRRKRIAVPHVKGVTLRRKYAGDMILRINEQLASGWNPFLALNTPQEYTLLEDACSRYFRYLYKMVEDGIMREKSYNGYASYLNVFRGWNATQPKPVKYVYQLKGKTISAFLEWLWMDKGNTARTRDNYLRWLRTLAAWMRSEGIISEDFTANLSCVQSRGRVQKNRTVIPPAEMAKIRDWCMAENPHFLLACYVLYYCLVRPKEMSYLKVGDVSVAKGTIFIAAEFAKNRKNAAVTLPDRVIQLMVDLKVLEAPSDWYLFGKGFRPAPAHYSSKQFGDYWTFHVKKALALPAEYKFYSLKDTGITDLIKDRTDLISVRDQARHHSLAMTDLYTPPESRTANEKLRHRQADF